MTSEQADELGESLTATGIATVTVASAARISKEAVVLLNSFTDAPPTRACSPSGEIRYTLRYSGAVRTDDSSDHVEATGTITYDNCFLDVTGLGRIKVNGTLNVSAFLGKQPSGRESMRHSGSITWTRDDGATGGCTPDWTTTLTLPDLRKIPNNTGQFCGADLKDNMQFVSTYVTSRRAAYTNAPPGLLPPTTAGPANGAGTWTGQIRATNPCSVGNPVGRYAWNGTVVVNNNNTFTLTWTDAYFQTQMVRNFPTTPDFIVSFNDAFDTITLTGRFSSDYRSITGTVSGSIDCVTSRRATTGDWDGRRTGP